MARGKVDKERLAGFAQELVDTKGATVKIDMKQSFGPVFEPFVRSNQWLSTMTYAFSDQARTVYKSNYSEIKSNVKDFDHTKRNKGAGAKIEEKLVSIVDTSDLSFSIYEKDYLQANDPLTTIGQRVKDELFVASEEIIDNEIEAAYVAAGAANTELAPTVLDVDSMDMTETNGKKVYQAILTLVEAFKVTAKTNDYHRGERFKNSEIVLKVSPKVDELVTLYKAGYITEAGLLNSGVFGSAYRNVKAMVMEDGLTSAHVIIHTERAVQGQIEPVRHFKYIDEAINQDGYTTEGNLVFGRGFHTVFDNEVATIVNA